MSSLSLRYNNLSGTLVTSGTDVTNSTTATTINFSAALTQSSGVNVPTIVSPSYLRLEFDPGTGKFEVVHLTAYTAGATTGTVVRAAEDATNWPAATHPSGTWVHAPAVSDFLTPTLPQAATVYTSNVASKTGFIANDGYTPVAGDTVLLTAQTTASQNGPWLVPTSGAWTRPAEFPSGLSIGGRIIAVTNGTAGEGSVWVLAAPSGGITVDTTSQTWVAIFNTASFLTYAKAIAPNQLAALSTSFSMNGQAIINAAQATTDTGVPIYEQLVPYLASTFR